MVLTWEGPLGMRREGKSGKNGLENKDFGEINFALIIYRGSYQNLQSAKPKD